MQNMTLGEHLEELRARSIVSMVAVFAAMTICWFLFESVMVDFMKAPLDMVAGHYEDNPFVFRNPILELLRDRLDLGIADLSQLKVLSIFESIVVRFKVSLLAGGILASPIVIGQIWKFIGTGLYSQEKKYAATYGIVSLFLFLFGCAFSFFLLFPVAVAVMLGNTPFGIVLRLEQYVSQAAFFTIGIGLMFELPLVLLFLEKIGVVNVASLRGSRRHVILVILLVSAMITPPDPLTQVIVALPVLGLYEASILILKMKRRRT